MLWTDSGIWDQNTDFQGHPPALGLLDSESTPGALGLTSSKQRPVSTVGQPGGAAKGQGG